MTDRTVAPSPSEIAAMLESRSAAFRCADEFLDLLSDMGVAVTRSDESRSALASVIG